MAKKQMSLSEMRAAALGAYKDHCDDMKNDPEYRNQFSKAKQQEHDREVAEDAS